MCIERLPESLRNIVDDGRSVREIIRELERKNISIFGKKLFFHVTESVPPVGTKYNFLGAFVSAFPKKTRKTADGIFAAACKERNDLRRPTVRSLLLLQERIAKEAICADIIAMNEPIIGPDGTPVVIAMSEEDNVFWVGTVNANEHPADVSSTRAIVLFLASQVEVV